MEASECHFLIGMCHIELKGYHEAKDAFTSAVKINPNYAQVRHVLKYIYLYNNNYIIKHQLKEVRDIEFLCTCTFNFIF